MAPRVIGKALDANVCVKCRERPPLPESAAFCDVCFLDTLEVKMKRVYTLARDPSGQRSGVVALSGGCNSRAVLELVMEFERREAAAKAQRDARWQGEERIVLHQIEVVHILESEDAVAPALPDGVPVRLLQLADLFQGDSPEVDLADPQLRLRPSSAIENGSLKSLLAALSPTSAASLRLLLRQRRIQQYAQEEGHTVVVYGDSATRLAARALDAISTGRAWALGEMVAPMTEEPDGLITLRPLHGIYDKDVALYSSLKQLPAASSAAPAAADITGLTDGFVRNLSVGFPATVSTVSKTAGKLDLRSKLMQDVPRCPLCSLPADLEAAKWRATHAVHSLDTNAANDDASEPSDQDDEILLAPLLCYACLVMLTDASRAGRLVKDRRVHLPTFVWASARAEREKRRGRIVNGRSGTDGQAGL